MMDEKKKEAAPDILADDTPKRTLCSHLDEMKRYISRLVECHGRKVFIGVIDVKTKDILFLMIEGARKAGQRMEKRLAEQAGKPKHTVDCIKRLVKCHACGSMNRFEIVDFDEKIEAAREEVERWKRAAWKAVSNWCNNAPGHREAFIHGYADGDLDALESALGIGKEG